MKFNILLILMNIVHRKFNFTATHSHTSFLSLSFVIITIMGHWWYQIILQKSLTVHDKGPARRMLLPVVRNIQITHNSIENTYRWIRRQQQQQQQQQNFINKQIKLQKNCLQLTRLFEAGQRVQNVTIKTKATN